MNLPPLYLSELISHRPPSLFSPLPPHLWAFVRALPSDHLMTPSSSLRFLLKCQLMAKTFPVHPIQNCNPPPNSLPCSGFLHSTYRPVTVYSSVFIICPHHHCH